MNTKVIAKCRYAFSVALFLPLAVASYAFQPQEKPAPREHASPTDPKAAAHREVSVEQRSVAQLGEKAGVKVEWHPRLGTPLSIRGPNLGQRRAYSGGKGLALRGGGFYEQDATAVVDNLASFYRIRDAEQEFRAEKQERDSLGFHHVRLTQIHQGLRVFGGDLIVHFDKKDQAYQVNGQYIPDIQVEVVPRIDADEAVRIAQRNLAAMGKPDGTLKEAARLVIFARDAEPQLAYELMLSYDDAKAGPGRWRYWIDAFQGKVLLRYNNVQRIAPPTSNGTNAVITGGILPGEGGQTLGVTGWYENTGYFYLYSTNLSWYVYNLATSGYPDAYTYAYRSISDWGTSDRAEMSAARNFDIVQRYYLEVHGLNSFNNAGIQAGANVHEGINYVNAFWDGVGFHFGDGDGVMANSLAVLDVCGHEFTHAVDQYSADLIYSGESGALNESFSDILGACIEFHAEPDGRALYPGKSPGTADWLCGEDCWLSSVALRDLRNPSNVATVGAGNQQPSRYQGTYWDPGGEVHQNDGVQNFFFYLLSEGGSGNNDGIIYSVTGIGVTNAEKVAYRALTVYCTPSTGYPMVRSAWMSAAMDLNPSWAASVGAAWSAVGISTLGVAPDNAVGFRGPVGGPFNPLTRTCTLFNRGAMPMDWSVTHAQAWLNVTPTGGTIPANGSNAVSLSINAAANALAMGNYADSLALSNNADSAIQTLQVNLVVGQPDYFTELFDTTANDLGYQTFTFTPDGSTSFYSVCREAATAFPTDPAGGTAVSTGDDTYAQVTLAGTNPVSLYGNSTNVFFIGSNGYITFGSGDSAYVESLSAHFNRQRIAALFDDLYPSTGDVTWKQMSNRVAVTYLNVGEYGLYDTNSFQIEMFFDGMIRITYLRIDATDGLAGLSAGLGVPAGFLESDLSSYGSCTQPLVVVVPPSATEGNGVLVGAGQVSLPFALTTNLTVALSSSDVTEVTVQTNVTLLAGQTNAAFDLTIVDDGQLDGTQTATITASTPGWTVSSANISIFDNETATLRVLLPATASEGQGTVTGAVQVSAIPAANITVSLSSSDTTAIRVPASVIIPSGQTFAVFTATVVDDNQIDGAQTATVTAHVQNWPEGSATVTVLDDESLNLTVTLPANAREGDGMLVNAGSVRISGTLATNLTVTLVSDDTTELRVPATALILTGQTSALFSPTVVDDSEVDGAQTVMVTASAGGFVSGSRTMTVYDDESPPVPFGPSPAHLATNVIQTTGLSWQSGAVSGEIITNDVYFGTNPTPGPGDLLGTTTNRSWALPLLAPQTTYYWQVVARKTGTTAGPVWQFTTRGVDHFTWSAVGSPQYVNQSFSATITAKDAFNTTVSNFNGSAGLRALGGQREIFHADFEGGLQGFTIDNSYGSGNGLWHLSTGRGSDPGHSPSNSLYYGHNEGPSGGGDYDNGTNNGGVVVSPSIPLPAGAGTLTLSFNSLINVEPGTNWDRAFVEVSTDGGGTYVPVAIKGTLGFTNTTGGLWVSNSVVLSQFAGSTVLLRFRFDTIDAAANSTEGWFIDDVVVRNSENGGPVSLVPTNTGAFISGVWSGSITVVNPATSAILMADDGDGHTGFSNPFDVDLQNDISISIADSPDPVSVGANLTYTLIVANTGPSVASGVVVTNLLPAGATFVSATPSQGTCTVADGMVACALGTIPGATNTTITIVVVPTMAGVTLTNLATVSRAEVDSYLGNNTADARTTVTPPIISIADASGTEGNLGTTGLSFAVTLAAPGTQTITVNFATANGTAIAGSDYLSTNGVLTFPPGTTNRTVLVTVLGDLSIEANETFYVNLSNPVNGVLGRSQAVGTILNDDGLPGNIYTLQWSSVVSPQYMNQPFTATLTARDAADNVATNFNGAVALSARTDWGGTNTSGTNTSPSAFPMDTYYSKERTQVIYPASELGGAGRITALALDVATQLGQTMNSWTIRMKHTPLTNYAGSHWESTGWTVVYQTNLSVTTTGWITFPLAIPFDYSGTSNLMVDFSFNNSTYSPYGYYCRSTYRNGLRTLYYQTTSPTDGDPLTWSNNVPPQIATAYTPNLRLIRDAGGTVPVQPTLAGPFANGLWSGRVTAQHLASNIVLRADDGQGHTGFSNPFLVAVQNDISIDVTGSPDPVAAGEELTYTLTVANSGPSAATGVIVTNILPSGANFVSTTASQGTCVQSGGVVRWDLGTVLGRTNATLTLVAIPTRAGTTITNLATVSRAEADATATNNIAMASTVVADPAITIADASVAEGNVGTINLVFPLTLTAPSARTITVNYATANGSAIANSDFIAVNGVVTFPPGITNQSVTVPVIGDALVEPNKTLFVTLSNPVNVVLGRSQGLGTILDDDALPGVVNHLVWDVIPSPQYTNIPFAVTITAMDASGNPATNFSGAANLSVAGEQGEILRADFETGLQAFTLDNSCGSSNGLWHLTTGRNADPGHSPSISLYYGQNEGSEGGGNYDTGTANGGAVVLPAIALPGGAETLTLSFNYLMAVEPEADYDQALVEVSTNNGVTYVAVASKNALGGLTNNTGGEWVSDIVDLSPFAGSTLWLRFRFDTLDSLANSTEGWFIDDIVIRGGATSVVPTNTGAFANGVWHGDVTIQPSATNVALRADDGAGHAGLSNPFNVIPFIQPPIIVTQPANQTVPVGGSATFRVTATGTAPLRYFWRRNGTPIPGANGTNYTLTNVQVSDSGSQFSCLVTNTLGSATSFDAVLKVSATPANDQCGGATLILDVNYTNSQSTVTATSAGDPVPGCVAGFGNGVWYKFTPPGNGQIVVDTAGSDFDTGLAIYTGSCGSLTEVACNDDADGWTSRIAIPVNAGATYYILAGGYSGHAGNLSFHLAFSTPPEVEPPVDQTVPVGGMAVFLVGATGTSPLSYTWQRNGTPIPGANLSSLRFGNAQLSDSGSQFRCVVSNALGSVTSSVAVLTVLPVAANDWCRWATFILSSTYTNTQSTTNATSLNDPVPSCIDGFGNGVWYCYTPAFGGQLVVDTSGSDFDTGLAIYTGSCNSLTEVACNDDADDLTSRIATPVIGGMTYYILAGGYRGDTGNLVLHLGFTPTEGPPEIVTQPASQTVKVEGTASFSVVAAGGLPFSYQWRRDGTNVTGAAGKLYTIKPVQLSHAGGYSVLVSNAWGSITSSIATLTVVPNSSNALLRFLPPQVTGGNLQLLLGTVDGSPLTPERAARIRVHASPTQSLTIGNWSMLLNPMVLTNGLLRVDGLNVTNFPSRFFCAEEFATNPPPLITPLQFLPPKFTGGNLQLLLATADGNPITVDRVSRIRIYASTNLSLPFSNWTQLPNPLGLSDGVLSVDGLSVADSSTRFFRAVETP